MACNPRRQAELEAQGWTRQFMAGEPRLSEAVEEYRGLGFDVRLEAVDPVACAGDFDCVTCFASPEAAARLKVIFTRPRDGQGRERP